MSKKKKVISALEFGEYINRYNSQLENALQLKNFSHSSTFSDNVNSACAVINTIPTETDDYDENWIDIREIMDNDEFEGPKAIFLLSDKTAYVKFTLSPYTKIICSDGFQYTNNSSNDINNIEHLWDLSKDIQYPNKYFKMRWILVYDLLPEGVSVSYNSFYRLNNIINSYECKWSKPFAIIYKNIEATKITLSGIIEYIKFDNCNIESISYGSTEQFDTNLTIIRNFVSVNTVIGSIIVNSAYLPINALSYPVKASGYSYTICGFAVFNKGLNFIMTDERTSSSSAANGLGSIPCDNLIYNSTSSMQMLKPQGITLKLNFNSISVLPSATRYNSRYIELNYSEEELSGSLLIWNSNLAEFTTNGIINSSLGFNIGGYSSGDCMPSLTNLVYIAEKLKDNTETASKSISIPGMKNQLQYVYVKNINDHLTMVDSSTEDAITLLEYITNKNWTIG